MNAYVNHGRWVAECATPYCTEAHLAEPGDRFLCGTCGTDHGLVGFPDDMLLIDAALSRRVVPTTRNWLPGEPVTHLLEENDTHIEVTL